MPVLPVLIAKTEPAIKKRSLHEPVLPECALMSCAVCF